MEFLIKGNPSQIMNWIQKEKEQIEYANYDERREEAEQRDRDYSIEEEY